MESLILILKRFLTVICLWVFVFLELDSSEIKKLSNNFVDLETYTAVFNFNHIRKVNIVYKLRTFSNLCISSSKFLKGRLRFCNLEMTLEQDRSTQNDQYALGGPANFIWSAKCSKACTCDVHAGRRSNWYL